MVWGLCISLETENSAESDIFDNSVPQDLRPHVLAVGCTMRPHHGQIAMPAYPLNQALRIQLPPLGAGIVTVVYAMSLGCLLMQIAAASPSPRRGPMDD